MIALAQAQSPPRSLPKNREAEQVVLGCALLEPEGVVPQLLDRLKSDQFYWQAHRLVYQALSELFDRGEPIDLVTVGNRLEEKGQLDQLGGRAYLSELLGQVTTTTSAPYYAQIVAKKALLRQLVETGMEISELGFQEEQEPEKLLDQAEERVFRLSRRQAKQSYHSIGEVLREHIGTLEKLQDPKHGLVTGLSTGFKELDKRTTGMHPSELIVIAGRPGMGKSAFAAAIARHVALEEGKAVGLFSLEMSKEQLVERLLCSEARINLLRLRGGHLGADSDAWRRIMQAANRLQGANILLDDTPAISIMELKAKSRRMKAEYDLDLLIVDYLQLVEGGGRADVREQEVAYISRSLKSLARELNIPVIALSQLSRAVERRDSKRPRLSDLRESGCLTGDTLITRADTGEQITIGQLAESGERPPLWTMDEQFKLRVTRPSRIFPSGRKVVYRLQTTSGRTIKASANHPFWTLCGWRRLSELMVGDRLAVPRRFELHLRDDQLDSDRIKLLGYLIGDGSYLAKRSIHFTNKELLLVQEAAECARQAFALAPKIREERCCKDGRTRSWYDLHFYSATRLARGRHNPLLKFLEELGIYDQRSHEKQIPQAIFKLPRQRLALFLNRLWTTDGSLSKSSGQWRLYYATTSSALAHQLQHLLLRFGIQSRLQHIRNDYRVHINGAEHQLQFCREIGFSGAKAEKVRLAMVELSEVQPNPNCDALPREIWRWIDETRRERGIPWRRFAQLLGMSYCGSTLIKHGVSRKRLARINGFLHDDYLAKLTESDLLWDEIRSIEEIGEHDVYDMSVPGTHNFVANDIIVENSVEQEADVVMFIFRKDYYDDQKHEGEQDDEEGRLAGNGQRQESQVSETELIIGKQRNGPTGSFTLMFHKTYANFYEPTPFGAPPPGRTPF